MTTTRFVSRATLFLVLFAPALALGSPPARATEQRQSTCACGQQHHAATKAVVAVPTKGGPSLTPQELEQIWTSP